VNSKEEEEDTLMDTARSVAWELIPFSGTLSYRGLHPIKLAYDHTVWPAQLTISAFN